MHVVRVVPKYGSLHALKCELARRGINVSKATIRRDLLLLGFKCRVRPAEPVLLPDFGRRVEFCSTWMTLPSTERLIFTDEKVFTVNDYTTRTQWVAHEDELLTRDRSRWPCGRAMAWMAIGPDFKLLVLFDAKDRLTGSSYVSKCLSHPQLLAELKKPRRWLQQDGAACHKSREVRQFLKRHKVQHVEGWPPRSPDLNPVELAWAWLQREVGKLLPTSQEELEEAVITAFDAMPLSLINSLVGTFRKRCRTVVATGGRVC